MDIRASPTEEQRASIDQSIKAFESKIRSLKEERNRLASINRLPPEVLTQIFVLVRDTSNEVIQALPGLGQVCGRWRSTALNSSALWSVVEYTRGEWTKETLRRAGTAPLHLTLRNAYRRSIGCDAAVTAISVLSRAQTFSSPRFPPDSENIPDSIWPTEAPLLESFYMNSEQVCYIPDHFTNGILPKLRHVKTINCNFRWSVNFLRNLTHLMVSINENWTEMGYPDVKEILGILNESNELRELRLTLSHYHLAYLPDTVRPPPIPTSGLVQAALPHLQVLELRLHAAMVTALLTHLPHPQTQLMVSCEFSTPDQRNIIMAHIQKFCSAQLSRGRQMEAVHIDAYSWSTRTLYLWDPLDCGTKDGISNATLALSFYLREDNVPDYFALVGPPLLQPTRYISVDHLRDLQTATVYISQCSIVCIFKERFIEISDPPGLATFQLTDGTPRLPSIEIFAISRVDFSKIPKTSRSPTRLTLPKFVKGLASITGHFSKLIFTNCQHFPDAQFTKLRRTLPIYNIESTEISAIENLNLIVKTVIEDN